MIVPMKHLTLLCVAKEGEKALEALRDLGCVHVDFSSAASAAFAEAKGALADAERAVRVLEPALAPFAREQSRFYALRLLEDDALFFARFGADLPALAAERIGEVCVRARAELDVAAHLVQIPV